MAAENPVGILFLLLYIKHFFCLFSLLSLWELVGSSLWPHVLRCRRFLLWCASVTGTQGSFQSCWLCSSVLVVSLKNFFWMILLLFLSEALFLDIYPVISLLPSYFPSVVSFVLSGEEISWNLSFNPVSIDLCYHMLISKTTFILPFKYWVLILCSYLWM